MSKIEELKEVVGKEVSQNQSPTLRGKLLGVDSSRALFEVVQSPYRCGDESKIGQRYVVPISWAWNAFFF
jgi:hypothetical protein